MDAFSFYKSLKVLVVGGAGFIGSHLVEKLVELGAKVTVLDNRPTEKIENLEAVKDKIKLIKGDITNPITCIDAAKNKNIIFHLAAFVSAPESVKKPFECYKINIEGTKNLLKAAQQNNVERFVFSSSSAVYGTKENVCTENMICKPESPYGFSKLMGEFWCQEYCRQFNLKTVCLRYFNVYGNRQSAQGGYAAVVPKFRDLMAQNKPVTIFGSGKQTRDYIPVSSIVDANLKLGTLPEKHLNGSAYNIASGKSITLLELLEILKKDFPEYNVEPIFEDERDGDIFFSAADTSKYENVFLN